LFPALLPTLVKAAFDAALGALILWPVTARRGAAPGRAIARGQKMGRPPKMTPHQQREAIKRRDRGGESLADIGRSYNVSGATISRLIP
jgi:hypothetical protein